VLRQATYERHMTHLSYLPPSLSLSLSLSLVFPASLPPSPGWCTPFKKGVHVIITPSCLSGRLTLSSKPNHCSVDLLDASCAAASFKKVVRIICEVLTPSLSASSTMPATASRCIGSCRAARALTAFAALQKNHHAKAVTSALAETHSSQTTWPFNKAKEQSV
jgi:hypothetical protein